MKSLKLFRTIIIIIVAATLSLIYPDFSYAENASVCQGYANGAINAFQRSQSLGCGFSGARWQSVYDNHYGWCLSAPPEAVQNEDRIRSAMLSACAKEPNGLFCDNYARTAVQQNEEALARNCGFGNSSRRWQSSYDNHLGWCVTSSRSDADSETSAREGSLSQCRGPVNVGPSPNQHCAVDCNVCYREGLRCDLNLDCSAQFGILGGYLCH